jgi:hypothetical protein
VRADPLKNVSEHYLEAAAKWLRLTEYAEQRVRVPRPHAQYIIDERQSDGGSVMVGAVAELGSKSWIFMRALSRPKYPCPYISCRRLTFEIKNS